MGLLSISSCGHQHSQSPQTAAASHISGAGRARLRPTSKSAMFLPSSELSRSTSTLMNGLFSLGVPSPAHTQLGSERLKVQGHSELVLWDLRPGNVTKPRFRALSSGNHRTMASPTSATSADGWSAQVCPQDRPHSACRGAGYGEQGEATAKAGRAVSRGRGSPSAEEHCEIKPRVFLLDLPPGGHTDEPTSVPRTHSPRTCTERPSAHSSHPTPSTGPPMSAMALPSPGTGAPTAPAACAGRQHHGACAYHMLHICTCVSQGWGRKGEVQGSRAQGIEDRAL